MITSDWASPGEAAVRYADLIFNRVREGMPINDWSVDWEREPFTHSFYPAAESFTLCLPDATSSVVSGVPDCSAARIGDLLHLSYGFVSQRLTINRNDRPVVYRNARWAKWGRTTASGGGRYCAEWYLVESGRNEQSPQPLPAGIYHYTPLRHAWERIGGGDATDRLARAQGYERTADRYLIMTINYWRSGFKYNDFAYQATSMDAGTVMATLAEIEGEKFSGTWDMWPNDLAVAQLLGLDSMRDGVYAIQAWGDDRPRGSCGPAPIPELDRVTSSDPGVIDFATTRAMQRDVAPFAERPEPFRAVHPVPRAANSSRRADWAEALMARQSSFGRFTGQAYPREALLAMLRHGDALASQVAVPGVRWMHLIYVTAVEGVAPGLYTHVSGAETIKLLSPELQDEFLASTYFLKNYDGRRAAATIIACANVRQLSQTWGVRGYRLVNAVVGALCQAISTEAVRHGVGTGTALGFDAAAHAERAGLDKDDMVPMLMIMTGVDDPLSGSFRSTAGARLVSA